VNHAPVRPIAVLLLLLALTGSYLGFDTLVQDLAYTRADTEIGYWGRGNYQPTPQAILETGQTLQALLERAPHHPEYLELQARYAAWQAYWSRDMRTRDALILDAVTSQHRALLSRPAHRHGWSKMVEYASSSSDEAVLLLAQKRLESLQPPKY
jgi:uncharacterized iron-regulated membrane protein